MTVHEIVNQFADQHVLVIGDLMLDRYLFGQVERISPEAPVPIVTQEKTTSVPGGAGNTAANIVGLAGRATLFGVIGDDLDGQELLKELTQRRIETGGIMRDGRPTTQKTRVVGNHQHIVRIDREDARPLADTLTDQLCREIDDFSTAVDAIVMCDYAKGVMSQTVVTAVRRVCQRRQIPLLADTKPLHRDWYTDLTLITPNRKELAAMTNTAIQSLADAAAAGRMLAHKLRTNLLITLSEEGVLTIDQTTGEQRHFPTKAQEVIDVSGAGDTVIAASALALAAGADLAQAADIANHAAGVVVGKLGTAVASHAELQAMLHPND